MKKDSLLNKLHTLPRNKLVSDKSGKILLGSLLVATSCLAHSCLKLDTAQSEGKDNILLPLIYFPLGEIYNSQSYEDSHYPFSDYYNNLPD